MTWATTAVTTIFYKQNRWRKHWNFWWYTYHGFDKVIIFKWLQLVLVVCKTPLQKHLLRFLKVDCWSSLNLESLWTPKVVLVCQFTLIFGLHSQLKQLITGTASIFKCASCSYWFSWHVIFKISNSSKNWIRVYNLSKISCAKLQNILCTQRSIADIQKLSLFFGPPIYLDM